MVLLERDEKSCHNAFLGRVSVATDETQKEKAKTVEYAGFQQYSPKKRITVWQVCDDWQQPAKYRRKKDSALVAPWE